MSKLQRKLRSRTGASMMLALLFLLFCSFVGGSVLVSATANAARVGLHNEQQDFLDQRSAVLLLSDELQLAMGQRFRLYILDAQKTIQDGELNQFGDFDTDGYASYEERAITIQLMTNANATVTGLQRLMLEATIWRYLCNEAAGEEVIVTLKDHKSQKWSMDSFSYVVPGATVTANGQNGYKVTVPMDAKDVGGVLTVTTQLNQNVSGISALPSYDVNFYSCGVLDTSNMQITQGSDGTEIESPDDLYDFVVDFGENSQLKLVMDGYNGVSAPVRVVGTPKVKPNTGNKIATQVTSSSVQTIVSWSDPKIEKGGA